jgi:hypothetical protein
LASTIALAVATGSASPRIVATYALAMLPVTVLFAT